jgi:Ribonucleotide reductase inhibitor
MPSERQAKRPYQSNITSYFPSIQPASSTPSQPAPARCTPPLPAAIQSSLLNVGMRIRKSVPEGYKTGHYCGSGTVAGGSSLPYATAGKIASQSSNDRHLTELAPYCGIMKVGDYALQRDDYDKRPGCEIDDALCYDQFDFPDGSQGSTIISTPSADAMPASPQTVNPQKRPLGNESEYEIGEMPLSPFIFTDLTPPPPPPPASLPDYPVSGISTRSINLSRPFARPRGRRKGRQAADCRNVKSYIGDEENMDGGEALAAQGGDDFGEADFLLPYSRAAAEVEMTGI